MARPTRVYRRKALPGVNLSGYSPPDVARDWLRSMLAEDNRGLSGQMDCQPWAVWLVWERESITTDRVSLLCCVGGRQARRIMDWACRLDGYLCRLYAGEDEPMDISHLPEWVSVHDWSRYWSHHVGEYHPMVLSDARLDALMARIIRE